MSREAQVDLEVTPYYHCVSRCVRRAFLCGKDAYSGKSFEHRRNWFLERLKMAADAFAIDVCAYAILSNHFHTILRVDVDRAKGWSEGAVLSRYGRFFPRVAKATRALPAAQRRKQVEVLRGRLTELGWFMRVINEHVARRANKEDGCSGRFWEGRYKSQALLDEAAVIASMSYVDLNPVRAGMARSLEGSAFTSIKQRLSESDGKPGGNSNRSIPLAPMRGEGRRNGRAMLAIRVDDYIELLEWTGRAVRKRPSGTLRGEPPAVLETLKLRADAWVRTMAGAGLSEQTILGQPASIEAEAVRRGKRWLKGKGCARALFA